MSPAHAAAAAADADADNDADADTDAAAAADADATAAAGREKESQWAQKSAEHCSTFDGDATFRTWSFPTAAGPARVHELVRRRPRATEQILHGLRRRLLKHTAASGQTGLLPVASSRLTLLPMAGLGSPDVSELHFLAQMEVVLSCRSQQGARTVQRPQRSHRHAAHGDASRPSGSSHRRHLPTPTRPADGTSR